MCKQAFALYLTKINEFRQEEKADKRCDHYLLLRSDRNKRKVFNAICQFTKNFGTAKRNLRVLYSNADVWLQRRGYFRWASQTKVKAVWLKKKEQNDNSDQFNSLNEILGKVSKEHNELSSDNQK